MSLTKPQGLNCQYKDQRDSTKEFGDDDIINFIDRANVGAFMTIRGKRGFKELSKSIRQHHPSRNFAMPRPIHRFPKWPA